MGVEVNRTLKTVFILMAICLGLGWYFLAPPIGFYSSGTNGKLKTTVNNTLVVYSPKYRLHWTGTSIQSGNFKQDNQYLFCWFWSGYGIKSMKVYSNTGQLLYDKSYGTKKEVLNSENFKVGFDAEKDWMNRDASAYLTLKQGEKFRVVIVDSFGNKFEDTIKAPAA